MSADMWNVAVGNICVGCEDMHGRGALQEMGQGLGQGLGQDLTQASSAQQELKLENYLF